ncbi:hypothetical protein [Rhodoferax sp.]|uniref:hypothetical protein n=1 Tax=Rhodoferax sp. TaxID=50421 RepID=UPI0026399CD5|nr:hypothetical protein [Rhodoferax sp.]MDD2924486.1 hypothetical protein [Rhodoferax sp.]
MNTACCVAPASAPLAAAHALPTWVATTRAWWKRWMASHQARRSACELTALDGLSPHSLKDIGAPEWVVESAQRAQERAHHGGLFERDTSHWR